MWGSSSPDTGPVLTAYSQKLDKVRLNLTLSTDFADQHLFSRSLPTFAIRRSEDGNHIQQNLRNQV